MCASLVLIAGSCARRSVALYPRPSLCLCFSEPLSLASSLPATHRHLSVAAVQDDIRAAATAAAAAAAIVRR